MQPHDKNSSDLLELYRSFYHDYALWVVYNPSNDKFLGYNAKVLGDSDVKTEVPWDSDVKNARLIENEMIPFLVHDMILVSNIDEECIQLVPLSILQSPLFLEAFSITSLHDFMKKCAHPHPVTKGLYI